MTDSNDSKPRARYTCGRCGMRWTGERTTHPVGCPKCRNYSTIGVVRDTWPPPGSSEHSGKFARRLP